MPCTSFSCNPLVLYCSPVDMVVRYGWRKALYNLMIKAWGFSASVSLVCDLYKLFLSAFLSPQLKWDGKSEGAWSLGIALPPSWGTALIELFPLAELAWLWRCSESISSDFCPSSYLRQEEEFFFFGSSRWEPGGVGDKIHSVVSLPSRMQPPHSCCPLSAICHNCHVSLSSSYYCDGCCSR